MERTINVYDYTQGERFQFVRVTDFLSCANDYFDCERHIATTDYNKIKELENDKY